MSLKGMYKNLYNYIHSYFSNMKIYSFISHQKQGQIYPGHERIHLIIPFIKYYLISFNNKYYEFSTWWTYAHGNLVEQGPIMNQVATTVEDYDQKPCNKFHHKKGDGVFDDL